MKSAYYKVPSGGDGAGDNCEWGGAGLSVAQFSSSSQLIKTHNLSNGSQINCWILVVRGIFRILCYWCIKDKLIIDFVASCNILFVRDISQHHLDSGWVGPSYCARSVFWGKNLVSPSPYLCMLRPLRLVPRGSLLNEPCKGSLHSDSLPLVGLL